MRELKQHLFDAYGGFADKRIKKLDSGDRFLVDDRTKASHNAKGQLFHWFCSIFATVEASDRVLVTLFNIPISPKMATWATRNGISHDFDTEKPRLNLTISPDTVGLLDELGALLLEIVRPGTPKYREPAYKYVCPGTAKSLARLADALRKAPGWSYHESEE